jgi:hypothetical protein
MQMSLVRYRDNSLVAFKHELSRSLEFHAHRIYYWLRAVAPIVIKYQLIQMGRDGIDSLPYLSCKTKQEIKRWLEDHYWETEQEIQRWLDALSKTKSFYWKTKQEAQRWLSNLFE